MDTALGYAVAAALVALYIELEAEAARRIKGAAVQASARRASFLRPATAHVLMPEGEGDCAVHISNPDSLKESIKAGAAGTDCLCNKGRVEACIAGVVSKVGLTILSKSGALDVADAVFPAVREGLGPVAEAFDDAFGWLF